MPNNEKITILVNSCDTYEDVWQPFFSAFADHWEECNHDILLNTENKSYQNENLNVLAINIEETERAWSWGKRLKNAVGKVRTEYTLMMFDDFILDYPVNKDELARCLDILETNRDIAAIYFISQTSHELLDDHRFPGYKKIEHDGNYKINSAPGLWRTEKLQQYTGDMDTPWGWEFFGTARTYRTSDSFYTATADNEQTLHYNYKMGGAIHRGKWVESVIRPAMRKYGLDIDLDKRGISPLASPTHSLWWKIQFVYCGWKMVGPDVFIFIKRAIIKRANRLFRT